MSEQNGLWKVILQTKKKSITNAITKNTRAVTVATILTSDKYQFIVNDYEVLDTKKDDDKSGMLEIDGLWYTPLNNHKYCGVSLAYAIKIYLAEWHILTPNKDITSIKQAVEYIDEINNMAKELYNLKSK